jgi:pimeloyl-ACP methyl ester carboxylesterase
MEKSGEARPVAIAGEPIARGETVRLAGADGIVLVADVWGPQAGRAVLLLHGAAQTRHSWRATGRRLGAAGYRAYAIDARGHGESDWSGRGEYTVDAMVRDVVSVCAALDDPLPVLVGASMGGGACLVAVGEGRVKTSGLVLVDIAPQTEVAGTERVAEFMRAHLDGFASLEEAADAISDYQQHRQRPAARRGLSKNLKLAADGRWYWHWDPAFVAERRDLKAIDQRRRSAAEQLRVPALLVRGGLSDVLTEEGAQFFLKCCPHAEYVSVPRAAHMITGDRNDKFCAGLIEFLDRRIDPNR